MKHIGLVLTLVLVAGLSRLIPHPWNFTAIGAMALFSGARMPHKGLAFLAPFLALIWTDAIIGFHSTMLYVYAAVAFVTILGFQVENKKSKILAGTVLGSVVFFVVTNFGVWLSDGFYPKTFEGLIQCYVLAIPFFGNQIAGDLFFSAVLFGAYSLITASSAFQNWKLSGQNS